MYGCIISRNIKTSKDKDALENFKNYIDVAASNCSLYPDLIITGDKWLSVPGVNSEPPLLESPFFIPGKSKLAIYETELSLGVAMCSLLLALNFIKLKPINYKYLIAEGLGLTMLNNARN